MKAEFEHIFFFFLWHLCNCFWSQRSWGIAYCLKELDEWLSLVSELAFYSQKVCWRTLQWGMMCCCVITCCYHCPLALLLLPVYVCLDLVAGKEDCLSPFSWLKWAMLAGNLSTFQKSWSCSLKNVRLYWVSFCSPVLPPSRFCNSIIVSRILPSSHCCRAKENLVLC